MTRTTATALYAFTPTAPRDVDLAAISRVSDALVRHERLDKVTAMRAASNLWRSGLIPGTSSVALTGPVLAEKNGART